MIIKFPDDGLTSGLRSFPRHTTRLARRWLYQRLRQHPHGRPRVAHGAGRRGGLPVVSRGAAAGTAYRFLPGPSLLRRRLRLRLALRRRGAVHSIRVDRPPNPGA